MVPNAAGRRRVCTFAGRSEEYFHVWFARMSEVLKHLQQTLFHVFDFTSGDATRFLSMLLPAIPSVRQYQ